MFQRPTTKGKVFVGLVISILALVILIIQGVIELHLPTYSGQVRSYTRQNNGNGSLAIVKKVDILQKLPEYMKITKLGDLRTVAKATNSYIEIRNKKSQYHIGDTIEIYVQLRDSRNEAIRKGGDVLRIWMTEERLNANSGGYVVDFNNGSYLGVVKALWVGSPMIKIAIGCTKEHVGIYLNFLEKYGTFIHLIGRFEKENHPGKAETQCASIPNSELFKGKICNFTTVNSNMSFYCEKPANFECKDWISFQEQGDQPQLENAIDSFFGTNVYQKLNEVTVRVGEDSILRRQVPSPVKSCSDFHAAETWNRSVPAGYMYGHKWISLQCSINLPRTTQAYKTCLTKTTLIFIGDSTQKLLFLDTMKFLSLKVDVPEGKFNKETWWPSPMRASSQDREIIVEVLPHGLPYAGTTTKNNLYSVSARLGEIGSNRSVIVLIHSYLHPARHLSPDRFRHHVKNAVDAIKSLLKRSPKAKILIKGPHSQMYPHYRIPYDFVAKFMEQVIYEEFKDIRNSVYYVDYWDMTLGNQNMMPHPPDHVNSIMINNFLSFVCHK